jgi:acyl carrier protein
MMTGESIETRIIAGLAKIKKTKPEAIQKQASLTEDLNIDSLDTLDLIFQLEEEFGIDIPEQDQLKFCTVQDVITYVQQRIAQPLARSA